MLEILDAWRSRGYNLRYIVTEALLKLNEPGSESIAGEQFPELSMVLNQVNRLLEQIENGEFLVNSKHDEIAQQSSLADGFILSIRKSAKPGLKIN